MIFIVGCDHAMQSASNEKWTGNRLFQLSRLGLPASQLDRERREFCRVVEGALLRYELRYITEEWGLEETTFFSGRPNYFDISMPELERAKLAIPPDWTAEYGAEGWRKAEERCRWQEGIEEYMALKVRELTGAENVLVICGCGHLEGLSKRLRAFSSQLQALDTTTCGWYQKERF